MTTEPVSDPSQLGEPVTNGELNSWRRGFTPQAEIWNGRMAMAGIVISISCLVLFRIFLLN